MITKLRESWLEQAESYWDELSGTILEELQGGGKFAVRLSMTIDGQRVKYAATVGKAGVKGTPREEVMDDPAQKKLEGIE